MLKKATLSIFLFSLLSGAIYLISSVIGLTPIFSKEETWATELFGFIATYMTVPFLWIKPGSILDHPIISILLLCVFWGSMLFCLVSCVRNTNHKRKRWMIAASTLSAAVILASTIRYNSNQSEKRPTISNELQAERTQVYLNKLSEGLEYYHSLHNEYPETIKQFNRAFPDLEYPLSLNDFINTANDQKLIYRVNNNNSEYSLFSIGHDGVEGTADDINSRH